MELLIQVSWWVWGGRVGRAEEKEDHEGFSHVYCVNLLCSMSNSDLKMCRHSPVGRATRGRHLS